MSLVIEVYRQSTIIIGFTMVYDFGILWVSKKFPCGMNIKVILLQTGGKGVGCGGSIPPDHQNLWDGDGRTISVKKKQRPSGYD